MKGVRILGVDGSTSVTGIALVEWDDKAVPRLLGTGSFNAPHALNSEARHLFAEGDSDSRRLWRIGWTRIALSAWVAALPHSFDVVAYEEPNQRGAGATAGLHQAIGAYLTLSQLRGLPKSAVHSSTVKSVAGVNNFRAAGENAAMNGEKATVCQWASRKFHIPFQGPCGEAEADAIGVCFGAYRRLTEKASGTTQAGKRGRKT